MAGRSDVVLMIAGRRIAADDESSSWSIDAEGLDDFFDSAPTVLTPQKRPGAHGDFDPPESELGARTFTLSGFADGSSWEWMEREARPWLASLAVLPDLDLRAFMSGRWTRFRRAKVNGRAVSREITPTKIRWQIPVYVADPIRYGAPAAPIEIDAAVEPSGGMRFPMVDEFVSFGSTGEVLMPGVFRITNPGTAGFVPDRFTVVGPLNGFTITSESNVIEYAGTVPVGQQLVITPYAGGRATLGGADVSHNLLQADWVAVQPGETRGYLFTPDEPGAGARLIVDYPEGAWW